MLLASSAAAQQADPSKLAPIYQQQRNMANDAIATCSVIVADLQAKIGELEKQLAAKTEPK